MMAELEKRDLYFTRVESDRFLFDDNYLHKKTLGGGAVSVAFQVIRQDDPNQRLLTLKVPHLNNGDESTVRFKKEIQSYNKLTEILNHDQNKFEHLVRFEYIKFTNVPKSKIEVPFIVYEFCDATLADVMSELQSDHDRAIALATGILDGLTVLHNAKFVHCDLKASNVLVQRSNGVEIAKVSDFDRSIHIDDAMEARSTGRTVKLTGNNIDQRLIEGIKPDQYSDLYDFGRIFYQMLSGNKPTLQYSDPLQKMENEYDSLVNRLLGKNYEKRGSAQDVKDEILGIHQKRGGLASATSPRNMRSGKQTLEDYLGYLRTTHKQDILGVNADGTFNPAPLKELIAGKTERPPSLTHLDDHEYDRMLHDLYEQQMKTIAHQYADCKLKRKDTNWLDGRWKHYPVCKRVIRWWKSELDMPDIKGDGKDDKSLLYRWLTESGLPEEDIKRVFN